MTNQRYSIHLTRKLTEAISVIPMLPGLQMTCVATTIVPRSSKERTHSPVKWCNTTHCMSNLSSISKKKHTALGEVIFGCFVGQQSVSLLGLLCVLPGGMTINCEWSLSCDESAQNFLCGCVSGQCLQHQYGRSWKCLEVRMAFGSGVECVDVRGNHRKLMLCRECGRHAQKRLLEVRCMQSAQWLELGVSLIPAMGPHSLAFGVRWRRTKSWHSWSKDSRCWWSNWLQSPAFVRSGSRGINIDDTIVVRQTEDAVNVTGDHVEVERIGFASGCSRTKHHDHRQGR